MNFLKVFFGVDSESRVFFIFPSIGRIGAHVMQCVTCWLEFALSYGVSLAYWAVAL